MVNNLQCEDVVIFSLVQFTATRVVPAVCLVAAFQTLALHRSTGCRLFGIAIAARTSADAELNDPTTQNVTFRRLQSEDSIDWPSA